MIVEEVEEDEQQGSLALTPQVAGLSKQTSHIPQALPSNGPSVAVAASFEQVRQPLLPARLRGAVALSCRRRGASEHSHADRLVQTKGRHRQS